MRVSFWLYPGAFIFVLFLPFSNPAAQAPSPAGVQNYSKEPYVVEKIVSQVQVENDGKYTAQTQVRVRIQSDLGVRDWGIIRLPYSSSIGTAEIADVEVTKPDGQVVTTPLRDVQDIPAPMTVAAPVYSDLKEKQLAVRGLEPGDILDYRETSHIRSPLIPGQFWFAYNFFKAGITLEEELQIRMPANRQVTVKSPKVTPVITKNGGYRVYTWKTSNLVPETGGEPTKSDQSPAQNHVNAPFADVQLTTFRNWDDVGQWYERLEKPRMQPTPAIRAKAAELTRGATSDKEKMRVLYNYVATKFRYVAVDFGIGRYQPHAAEDVLNNGFGDCKDKDTLLASLLAAVGIQSFPALINAQRKIDPDVPSPGQFNHVITAVPQGNGFIWLDTTEEVAPFGYLSPNLRNKKALVVGGAEPARLVRTEANPPFPSSFVFRLNGKMSDDGTLKAWADLSVRGDLELLLRTAFRQATQEQWNPIVQAISRSWSSGGTVSGVQVSPPDATEQPFNVQYAYTRTGYPNWPDAIRMPLPAINLTQLPKEAKKSTSPIPLEAPGEYLLDATIRLPGNLVPQVPAAVSAQMDFAEYHATYTWAGGALHVVRKLTIHMRDIPRARRDDYVAFRKTVSDDEKTLIALSSSAPASSSATSSAGGSPANSTRVESLISLGTTLFYQNNPTGAITEYRKALQLSPDNFRAHKYLGDALDNSGEYAKAAAEYRAALRLNPDNEAAHTALADALFSLTDNAGAAAEYRAALRLNANDADAHSGLGETLLKMHDLTAAAAEYRAALRLKPNDADVHYNLGLVLDSQHNWDGAIAEYREAVRLKPDDADAHFNLGVDLEQQRNLTGAVAEYRAALRYKPDSSDAEDRLGKDLIFLGHPAEGSEELKEAITAMPGHASDYAMLGTAYAAMHRYDDALAAWKHAQKLKPGVFPVSNIASILIEQKRYARALAELNPAITENPKNVTLMFLLAEAEIKSGDRENGVAELQKVVQLDPTPDVFNEVAYDLATEDLQLDDALAYAKRAVGEQESETMSIDLQNLKMSDFADMARLASDWDTLGVVEYRLGHFGDALKYLDAAWRLSQNPDMGAHLAQLYEKTDDRQKAIHFYALALATGHAPPEVGGRLVTLLGSMGRAEAAVQGALPELTQSRTIDVPRLGQGKQEADFFILFTSDSERPIVRFIRGSPSLQAAGKALASADYHISFADDTPVKLVRRGTLSCPPTGANCHFVLLLPTAVNSLN